MQPRDEFIFHRVAVFKGELVQQLSQLSSCDCICKSFFWGGVQSMTPPPAQRHASSWASILQSDPLAQPPAT